MFAIHYMPMPPSLGTPFTLEMKTCETPIDAFVQENGQNFLIATTDPEDDNTGARLTRQFITVRPGQSLNYNENQMHFLCKFPDLNGVVWYLFELMARM
jgi:ureidoglycolate hydrolase